MYPVSPKLRLTEVPGRDPPSGPVWKLQVMDTEATGERAGAPTPHENSMS